MSDWNLSWDIDIEKGHAAMNITLRNVPDFFFESSIDYFNR